MKLLPAEENEQTAASDSSMRETQKRKEKADQIQDIQPL
jgi:hypothetical protein